MVFSKSVLRASKRIIIHSPIQALAVPPLSVVFRRTTIEVNDKPDWVWYFIQASFTCCHYAHCMISVLGFYAAKDYISLSPDSINIDNA